MNNVDELKQRAMAEVDAWRDELIRTADAIHAHPETAFEEFKSAAALCDLLERNGFAVERGVAGMETAFVATLHGRNAGPTVALLAEYDALPGLGHACGHNLIGTSAAGAGLALKAVLPELAGAVQVVGTPAEEEGGGKAIMVDAGVFEGVDAAMMVHPSSRNTAGGRSLSCFQANLEFFGKSVHASVQPEKGINALDAVILTFNGINALRQHLRDDSRIHGIITRGGEAPNIVPDYAAAKFYVRAADTPYAAETVEKVRAVAEGAAQATGARLEFKLVGPRYDARLPNPKLAQLVEDNMAALGLEVTHRPESNSGMGSSDMGNVSQVVPSLHPSVAIGPEGMNGHSIEMREAAASPAGHEGMIAAAKLMAMTTVDLLADPDQMRAVKQAFEEQKKQSST
jgi:amidohydrolase